MISYRKLAMRVLGHSPVSAVKTARRSTGKRAAALAHAHAAVSAVAGVGVGRTRPHRLPCGRDDAPRLCASMEH